MRWWWVVMSTTVAAASDIKHNLVPMMTRVTVHIGERRRPCCSEHDDSSSASQEQHLVSRVTVRPAPSCQTQ